MSNSLRKTWLPLGLLLGSLGWTLGCAGGVPQTTGSWRTMEGAGQRATSSQAAANLRGRKPDSEAVVRPAIFDKSERNVNQTAQTRAAQQPPADRTAPLSRGLADTGPIPSGSVDSPTRQSSLGQGTPASAKPVGNLPVTSHHFSDSAVPNPLRGAATPPAAASQLAGGASELLRETPPKASNQRPARANAEGRFAVQTVGYQEELPEVIAEEIPAGNALNRLAMLEEPQPMPDPASVLEATSEPPANPDPPEFSGGEPLANQLPVDNFDSSGETPQVGFSGQFSDRPLGQESQLTLNAGAPMASQGHYQQGSAVFGQMLNPPQQTASQRALQLMEENRRLEEEMKAQLKQIESLQARLKQQDELWVRARQEFVEVRSVVDNLTRENLLLKQQLEKTESEKVELARQYQGLMQTVEQTLDELLLRAIAQPPAGGASPTTPTTQPAPTPPMFPGQQASSLKSSQ